MSVLHPSPARVETLRKRWEGQESRLQAIAADLLAGRDWTVHLAGLPLVDEIPPLPGEQRGRDLRGADLGRLLRPSIVIDEARETEAALVSAIALEGLRRNTPLEDVTPFPVAPESAADISVAMRRGERFLIARLASRPAGVVRFAPRTEQRALTADRAYVEISCLAVLPSLRRQGIGEALRAAAERRARAAGFDHALLHTTLELGLVPWYERAGYAVLRTRQATCPEGTTYLDVVMGKRLVDEASATSSAMNGATSRARPRIYRC